MKRRVIFGIKMDKLLTDNLSARWARSEKLESLSLLLLESVPMLPFSRKSLTIAAKSLSLSWLNPSPTCPKPPTSPPLARRPCPASLNHASPGEAHTLQSIAIAAPPKFSLCFPLSRASIPHIFLYKKKTLNSAKLHEITTLIHLRKT